MNISMASYNKRFDLMTIGQRMWVGKGHRLLNDPRFITTARDRKLDTGATYVEIKKVSK